MNEKKEIKHVNTRRINITILEKEYEEIQTLVKENKYLTVSEFVREGIRLRLNMIRQEETLKNINNSLIDIEEAIYKTIH